MNSNDRRRMKYAVFSKYLEEGEVVEYAEHEGSEWNPIYVSLFTLLATLIIGISLSFFKIELSLLAIIIGGIFLASNIYSIFYDRGIAVTNRKIIILGKIGKPRFTYLHEIFDIKTKVFRRRGKEGKNLYINKKAHVGSQIIEQKILLGSFDSNINRLEKKIRKAWSNQSPYALFNQKMKSFAIANELKMTHLDFKQKNEFKLQGKINGLLFNLSLNNAANFNLLKVYIYCKNEEDNFICLRPEVLKDNLTKLLGVQDYQINQKWFDDKFIIQSNYEPFIQSILTDDFLPIIDTAMSDLKGEITLGNKSKMEKSSDFDIHEEQILDAHLISEKEIAKQRRKDHGNSLTYTSSNLKYTDGFEKIAGDIILNIKMLTALAERINSYNEVN